MKYLNVTLESSFEMLNKKSQWNVLKGHAVSNFSDKYTDFMRQECLNNLCVHFMNMNFVFVSFESDVNVNNMQQ